jgi:hypothetical protein
VKKEIRRENEIFSVEKESVYTLLPVRRKEEKRRG